MSNKFPEHKGLNLSQINKDILKKWDVDKTFEKSLSTRDDNKPFVFYEGPPSANGVPGIHHVIARSIKDVFCRYKTLKGFQVKRKAGWDTHGLPVELSVEKAMGITKEDIGTKITVEEYNAACRKDVMKYTDLWADLTEKMGYWVDMENPYITYDNRYIESIWYLLKELYKKDLIYKGYTIQPFSPAAGTGLSTHELNQPGCYQDVKDTTAIAQFNLVKNEKSTSIFENNNFEDFSCDEVKILAWTTTPWTLPSNTALAVGTSITYVKVATFNQYTGKPIVVILAKDRQNTYFNADNTELSFADYKVGDKKAPFKVLAEYTGKQLEGMDFEQLITWIKPMGNAFKIILGDYVTTEDGTGIVHIAPTFGADDDRVAKAAGILPLVLIDKDEKRQPMVDKRGRFFLIEDLDKEFVQEYIDINTYKEFAGRFVKNAYDENLSEKDITLDIDISVMLKKENKAFKVEKHEHNYPHCWRTDKPILYYPLDSWFVKTTAKKERMFELNKTINWKPESTGTGRFGKWLENLQDWNLSRSRYWGTPLPVWVSEDRLEEICIGSVEELMIEIEKSVEKGFMKENPFKGFVVGDNSKENYDKIDLHRPFVDNIILVSETGQKLVRELDLIDVWFDSGAMPYAQLHYPFENKELIDDKKFFPADFIAEGVDQTRGWFFTLHAISTMLFDSVAFKNIISNGLVLDKKGNKMSKRLGNATDPFGTIEKSGSDPLRWYMITNASPWDNIKFDIEGIEEVKRKFFGTLYNTYSFFALYANVDNFHYAEKEVPVSERPEIDKWIISLLNSLVKDVESHYENYEPTRAGRAIQNFVTENLSNWYVRLNRKRFWGSSYNNDKIAAYQTLYICLETVAKLMSPIAPFFADQLFLDLNKSSQKHTEVSIHLSTFPTFDSNLIDKDLEERMDVAQRLSSMVLALRRKVKIKVRQPLSKMMIPIMEQSMVEKITAIKDIVLAEVNVKEIEFIDNNNNILVKKVKPDFKALGRKLGKNMKLVAQKITSLSQGEITSLEQNEKLSLKFDEFETEVLISEVEIISEDIPGWLVANEGKLTVALDVTVTEELKQEGIAREIINRVQNLRKDSGLEVTDKINLFVQKNNEINNAIDNYNHYISSQTLAVRVNLEEKLEQDDVKLVDINDIETLIKIEKA